LAQRHQAAIAQAPLSAPCNATALSRLAAVIGETVALDLRAGKHDGLVDGGVAQPVVSNLRLCCVLSAQKRTA
jgi:hypothetical protein